MKVGDLEHFKNMSFLAHSARGALRIFILLTDSLTHCSAYLPSLTTEQVKTEDTLPPLMLHSDSVTSNKLFVNDDMYCHVHGGLVIGM